MPGTDSTESGTRAKRVPRPPELSAAVADVLDRRECERDKLALRYLTTEGRERHVSLSSLADQSRRCANLLHGLGVRPGAPVIVMLPSVVEWCEIMLGCLRAGVAWVPVEPALTAESLVEKVNVVGAQVLVAHPDRTHEVDRVRDRCPAVRHLVCIGGSPRKGWVNYRAVVRLQDPDTVDTAIGDGATSAAGVDAGNTRDRQAPEVSIQAPELPWEVRSTDVHWPISAVRCGEDVMREVVWPWEKGACLFMDSAQHHGDPARILRMLRDFPITTMSAPASVYRSLARLGVENLSFARLRHAVVNQGRLDTCTRDLWKDPIGLSVHEV